MFLYKSRCELALATTLLKLRAGLQAGPTVYQWEVAGDADPDPGGSAGSGPPAAGLAAEGGAGGLAASGCPERGPAGTPALKGLGQVSLARFPTGVI